MPKRPRSHQIEGASNRVFENALPPAWVPREQRPDYGIDYTVEVFDGEDSTGRIFNAQLKSTDESDLERALGSVRFKRETADYYRSLAAPVLIVLYHAPTDSLFARWFHAYNPHLATGKGWDADAKTMRFQFYENDRVGADTFDLVDAGLKGFLEFRSPDLALPLQVAVASDVLEEEDVYGAALALRGVLSPVSDLVAIAVREPGGDDPLILLGKDRSVASLADVASVTLDEEYPDDGEGDLRAFAADLALGLSVALVNVGQANLAAQIAAAVAAQSRVVVDTEVAMTVAGAMYRSRRIIEAIDLTNALDESEDDERRTASYALLMVLLARGEHMTDSERAAALSMSEQRVQRRQARRDLAGAAAEAYSLGMLRRQVGDLDAAIDAFRQAAQLDAAYLERAYYHRDLAAALFNNGEFDQAAEHYERAIGLGSEDLTVALRADALLFSGKYEAALQEFDDYLRSTPGDEDAPWRLKTRVLRHIVEIVGPRQDRDPEGAEKPLSAWDLENGPDLSIEEAWQLCSEAVSLDACYGEAWFRLGLLAIPSSASSPSVGGIHSLAGAVLRGGGEASWTNALLCVEPGEDDLVSDLCEVAYHSCGDSFVQKATASVKGAEHLQSRRGDILKALDEAVARVDAARLRRGFTMRFRRDDGGMDELVFGAPEESSVSQEVEVTERPTWRPASAKPLKPRRKRAPKTYGKKKGKKKRKR